MLIFSLLCLVASVWAQPTAYKGPLNPLEDTVSDASDIKGVVSLVPKVSKLDSQPAIKTVELEKEKLVEAVKTVVRKREEPIESEGAEDIASEVSAPEEPQPEKPQEILPQEPSPMDPIPIVLKPVEVKPSIMKWEFPKLPGFIKDFFSSWPQISLPPIFTKPFSRDGVQMVRYLDGYPYEQEGYIVQPRYHIVTAM